MYSTDSFLNYLFISMIRVHQKLIKEDSDVALIRLFECFLESAPQKILQISIILSGEDTINCEYYMTCARFEIAIF